MDIFCVLCIFCIVHHPARGHQAKLTLVICHDDFDGGHGDDYGCGDDREDDDKLIYLMTKRMIKMTWASHKGEEEQEKSSQEPASL